MSGIISQNVGRASGLLKAVAGDGGAWNIIGTVVASDDASLTITGLDSTYDTFAIAFSDFQAASDGIEVDFRLGDSSGVDSGASDYSWMGVGHEVVSTTYASNGECDNLDAQIKLVHDAGGNHNKVGQTSAGEGWGGLIYLHRPGDGAMYPMITGQIIWGSTTSIQLTSHRVVGQRRAVIAVDRVYVAHSAGNITSGRMTVWGLADA
jgi:hypothetical protein